MTSPLFIDGREMVPPEPLEATVAALDTLAPGQTLTLLLNCQPHPLYQLLRRNGYKWTVGLNQDGSNVISIQSA